MTPTKKAKMDYNDLPPGLTVKRGSDIVSQLPSVPRFQKEEDEYEVEADAEDDDADSFSNRDSKSGDKLFTLDNSGIFIIPAIPPPPLAINIPEKLLKLEWSLSKKLGHIQFPPPVEYVYNPVEYAFDVHARYVRKFCQTTKRILFLGMNPGPWGMMQTGVPFGEVNVVRDWLQVSGSVKKPSREQPNKKVTGFSCTRSEVSGRRLWGLFKEVCGSPENFFRESYMHNYCPTMLMDAKGRNITPADLKGSEKKDLQTACDEALAATIRLLEVDIVVGIGRFAEKRAQTVVRTVGLRTEVLSIPHPSLRSRKNQNWSEKAMQQLRELNLLKYLTK